MKLLSVEWLWLLWLVPALALVLVAARRRGAERARVFLGAMAPRLVRGARGGTLRGALALSGVTVLVLALARPAWGVRYEEVHGEGLEMVVVLDVSRSMLAEDAAPSRLERARIAIERLLDRVHEVGGHRVGLIAFAGLPVVRAPVTADIDFLRSQVRRTGVDDVARGGTLIGDAVRRAMALLDRAGEHDRVILVLTDGEDHESFPLEAARAAADAGIRLFTVGIGDPNDGARIPGKDATFQRHEGREVVTRLDEDTLREMAQITGGAYVPAGTRTIPLDRIYDEAIAGGATGRFETRRERRDIERFQWAVGLALVLIVLSRLGARRDEDAA